MLPRAAATHRVKHDAWPGAGLWYDDGLGYPIARVKESWALVAEALCGHWNVVAADLVNGEWNVITRTSSP